MKSKFYLALCASFFICVHFKSFSQANTSLSNLASATAINHSLTAGATNSLSLGTSSTGWRNLYLTNGIYLNGTLFFSNPLKTSIAIGNKALYLNSSSGSLIAIGDSAFYNNTTGARGIAIGSFALYKNTTGDNNTTLGYQTLYNSTTGSSNVATGMQALYNNTTGSNNIASGAKALYANTTGYSNIAIGIKALYSNTTAKQSVAIGDSALYNGKGSDNVAIGSKALYTNTTGTYNTAIGYHADTRNTSSHASAIGNFAYADCSNCLVLGAVNGTNGATTNTNVGIGTTSPKAALQINGTKSLSLTSSGYLQLGDSAGYNLAFDAYEIQGRNNGDVLSINLNPFGGSVYLGSATDSYYGGVASGYMYGLYSSTSDGTGVYSSSVTGSGVIGYASITGGENSRGVNAFGNYGIYATTLNNDTYYAGYFAGDLVTSGAYTMSDQKLKENIRDVDGAMDIISRLHPKTYNFRQDGDYTLMNLPKGERYGLIAQDVEKVLPNLVKNSKFDVSRAKQDMKPADDPKTAKTNAVADKANAAEVIDFKALNYTELIPVIIKGMQEMNTEKDAAIADLQNQINQLKAMVVNLSAINGQQSTLISSASLAQNVPNPFTNATNISYVLPQQYSSAVISITDKKGVALKQIKLNTKGKGNINIDAATLAAGAYQYSLYVNNKLVDTKQMISVK